ncbi:MAG: methyltransferase domain-containing protein [Acidimicrobiia bacterium]|nr:methyltransferase domain-containing protein [Acidimicrobiia bacterium]
MSEPTDDPGVNEAGSNPSENMTESMREVMSLDGDIAKLSAYYGKWASYYDADVAGHDYGLPRMMLAAVKAASDHDEAAARYLDRSVPVLDAGCGTGLVGAVMHDAGYTDLTGIDLSFEMIEKARERGIYRSLEAGIDLSEPVPEHLVGRAMIVLVGGVFTVGHIPPESLALVADLTAPGGLLVVSTRRSYQDETDFVAVQQAMIEAGGLELLAHLRDAPYTMDSTGDYWAWRVSGS